MSRMIPEEAKTFLKRKAGWKDEDFAKVSIPKKEPSLPDSCKINGADVEIEYYRVISDEEDGLYYPSGVTIHDFGRVEWKSSPVTFDPWDAKDAGKWSRVMARLGLPIWVLHAENKKLAKKLFPSLHKDEK